MELVQKIRAALFEVLDPELGVNIMDLGLIYDVVVDEITSDVTVDLTLTTPGCPMASSIQRGVKYRIKQIAEVGEIKVKLVFDPPWSPEMMSERCKEYLRGKREK